MIAHLAASTLVALAAVAAAMALRGRSGAWRHGLLLAAILRFAIPTPWLATVGAKLAPYAHTRSARPASVDLLADFLLFGDTRLGTAPVRPQAPAKGAFHLLAAGWTAGFGLFLALWVRGLLRGIPAIRAASPEEEEALSAGRRAFGSGATAALQIAAAEQAPGVRGMWRASIILPEGLSSQLSSAELEAVLLHELAHLRRRDNLTAAIGHLVVCIFWFYPPIWWLERRMLEEREAACDEMALARGAGAEEYLAGLIKVCRIGFAAMGYAGAGGSSFQTRMERIMSPDFRRSVSPAGRACAAAVVAVAVMIPASGAFLKAQQAGQPAPASAAIAPASVEGRVQAGMAMLRAGNPAGAEEAFRMARALDPKNMDALTGLVEALMDEGKTGQAMTLLKRADRHLALGNVAVRAQNYDLALTEFQTALDAVAPGSAAAGDIHMRMGETYRRMGKTDAAIAQLRLAKDLVRDPLAAMSTLALVLDSAGRWEEAQKEYAAVIQIAPDNGVALNNLAFLLSRHGGNLELALQYAQQAEQLLPQMPEVSDTLGAIYLARGMTDAALEVFRKVLQDSPANAEHSALRLAQKGQREAVLATLTAARATTHSKAGEAAIEEILRKLK